MTAFAHHKRCEEIDNVLPKPPGVNIKLLDALQNMQVILSNLNAAIEINRLTLLKQHQRIRQMMHIWKIIAVGVIGLTFAQAIIYYLLYYGG